MFRLPINQSHVSASARQSQYPGPAGCGAALVSECSPTLPTLSRHQWCIRVRIVFTHVCVLPQSASGLAATDCFVERSYAVGLVQGQHSVTSRWRAERVCGPRLGRVRDARRTAQYGWQLALSAGLVGENRHGERHHF